MMNKQFKSKTRRLIAGLFLMLSSGAIQAESLLVYSGAGLRPAVQELAQLYEQRSGIKVMVNYGGSGQLLTRFKASGKGDVFIPGSKIYFASLADEVFPARDIVAHTPVIGVAKSTRHLIQTFSDLSKSGVRIGLGDAKSMALGRSAEKILDASGMGQQIRANVVLRAATVKQLVLYLTQGEVDSALIGRTDALLNADKVTMLAIPDDYFQAEIVAVGVLKTTTNAQRAQAFADLLVSEEGINTFKRFGFLAVPGAVK